MQRKECYNFADANSTARRRDCGDYFGERIGVWRDGYISITAHAASPAHGAAQNLYAESRIRETPRDRNTNSAADANPASNRFAHS
jgi:hypothetical protein